MNLLYLYKVDFKVEKNPLIDNLDDYLATCDLTNYSVQYQKNNLSLTVKIPYTQMAVKDFDCNYATIQNEGENKYYYYIVNTEWRAKNTIELTLELDTVNTLNINNSLNPEQFTEETKIIREHRDRFIPWNTTAHSFLRNIDRESEGIEVANQKESDVAEPDMRLGDGDWFLMFKTREGLSPDNPNNPLGVYLIPENSYQVNVPSSGNVVINHDDLEVGRYYYFTESHNSQGTVKMGGNETNLILGVTKWNEYTTLQYICMYIKPGQDNKIFYKRIWKNDNTGVLNADYEELYIDYMTFSLANELQYGDENVMEQPESVIETAAPLIKPINANVDHATIKNIDALDRTDSKILKLFRLPYCPINIQKNASDILTLPAGWEVEEGLLKYTRYNLPDLTRNDIFPIDLFRYIQKSNVNITDTDEKDIQNESKLFNSEFFNMKLVYGNESHPIKLENIHLNPDLEDTDIYVNYQNTNTGNSDMLFTLDYSELGNLYEDSDYDKYFMVNPINEETILSSDYLNYIRNGYNYDKKTQKLAITQAAVNTAINAAQTLTRIGQVQFDKDASSNAATDPIRQQLEDYKGKKQSQWRDYRIKQLNSLLNQTNDNIALYNATNSLVKQQIIGAGFNAITAGSNIFFTAQAQKNQMASKLTNLEAQATQMKGGGSIDLFKTMTNNKLHLIKYEPRREIKNELYDLFDKYGYNHPYTEVPNVTSRIWYNYIQCEPKFDVESSYDLPKDWLEDLRQRYQLGVTVYHKRDNQWNFEQKYENWEKSVIGE